MTIVVGYVPRGEGKAALRRAAEEARLRSTRLVVINSNKGGTHLHDDEAAEHEKELAEVRAQLDAEGIEHHVSPTTLKVLEDWIGRIAASS